MGRTSIDDTTSLIRRGSPFRLQVGDLVPLAGSGVQRAQATSSLSGMDTAWLSTLDAEVRHSSTVATRSIRDKWS